MCGVVGVVSDSPVNQLIFDSLTILQHRGQDAAGIATFGNGRLELVKSNGLVREAFQSEDMKKLKGNLGIGHVRYPTAGTPQYEEAQPLYVNSPYGITLAHNGNLTNAYQLRQELIERDLRHLNTQSDSEVLLNVLAHELHKIGVLHPKPDDIFEAVKRVYERARGGYAVVALLAGLGLLAFRDPFGIRPLVWGTAQTDEGKLSMIASESVALQAAGIENFEDLKAGEAVFITETGVAHRRQLFPKAPLRPCLFELVYLARADSIIDKISVYKFRRSLGKRLAEKIAEVWPDHKLDAVIPIPETSRFSAVPLAQSLGVKYTEGFVKNRYIGRTFIMPKQTTRKRSVNQKLSTIPLEFQGKAVLLVDDSIVRGTTSREIIQMARNAGAHTVYFASTAPPIRYPNAYGIDMPLAEELVAHGRTVEEVAAFIGADKLIFLDLEDLISAAREGNPAIEQFEASVFDGKYITGDESEYLARVRIARSNVKLEG